ncbi:MAG: FHA domain-containing protein [Chloroflexi bacterium]|nr:FHA domain-containing protein [Chloroflexota bacterium]
MKKICPKCGFSENNPEWEYCQQCDAEFGSISQPIPVPATGTIPAKIVVYVGARVVSEYTVIKEYTTIGRSDSVKNITPDIDLTPYDIDRSISRPHARILSKGSKYFIEDIKSANGTTINNGPPLSPAVPVELRNNDEIRITDVTMKFILSP